MSKKSEKKVKKTLPKKTSKLGDSAGAMTIELPELHIGDVVCVGKFKNRKATIQGFGIDKNNQPTVLTDKGEHPVFKFRLQKLMESNASPSAPLSLSTKRRVLPKSL